MEALKRRIDAMERSTIELKTQQTMTEQALQTLLKRRNELNVDGISAAMLLLEKMSETQREDAKQKLENLCTMALQYAVSEDLCAEIEVQRLRNKPAATLYVTNKVTGNRVLPLGASGGGIADILSTALRYILLESWTPRIEGPILMDEAYKHLSKEYTPEIADFIYNLGKQFDRQTVLSTHDIHLANCADKEIHVALNAEGHSVVTS